MHPDVRDAITDVETAEAALREILTCVRKTCRHEKVIHSNWRSSNWGSAFKARRLCLACGLEEEAKHSGFGESDIDFRYLKTNGFHKVVSSDELYKSRFPETEVDCA